MINSRFDGHEWKSAPNHWLRILNICVKGFDDQTMSLEVGFGS